MFVVIKDNKILFTGSSDDCFSFLLKHQPFSVSHATTYGGYKIQREGIKKMVTTWTMKPFY